MDHSQSRITVFHCINDNTHGKQIIHLIQRFILIDHFFINAEEMFDTPVYFCFDMGVRHMLGYFRHDLLDEFLPLCLAGIQIFHKLVVDIRLPVF